MARNSETGNVTKRCKCIKWKLCTHRWYIDYRDGSTLVAADGTKSRPGLRKRLRDEIGFEPTSFADAKEQAARAIRAYHTNRDARSLLPEDAPTVAQLVLAYAARPTPSSIMYKYHRINIPKTIVNGRPFGEYKAAAVTSHMIEVFKAHFPTPAANRYHSTLSAMFNWAVEKDLVPSTPFKKGNVVVVHKGKETARDRRMLPGEFDRIMAVASPYLRDIIVGCLDTACRAGELTSLQWAQVFLASPSDDNPRIVLRAGKTKAKKPREIPLTGELHAVMVRRRLDPAGHPLPPTAYVFGDEVGKQLKSGYVKPWQDARLKAYGYDCKRTEKGGNLPKPAWKALKVIDLHLHDLRREAGSRLLEGKVLTPVQVQEILGHSNLSQTSTYLKSLGGRATAAAMRAHEIATGRTPVQLPEPEAPPPTPEVVTNCDQFSSQVGPDTTSDDQQGTEKTNKNTTKRDKTG